MSRVTLSFGFMTFCYIDTVTKQYIIFIGSFLSIMIYMCIQYNIVCNLYTYII